MKFEIWDKNSIKHLLDRDKEQWFDIYNLGLEEDRGFSLADPNIKNIQKRIKADYMSYIDSCAVNDEFYKYYVVRDNGLIVSQCRINISEDKMILEGLQTHHNFYHKGYAVFLIKNMIKSLKEDGIDMLYSEARIWNDASNHLQRKIGFKRYNQDDLNYYYKLDIGLYLK